VNLSMLTSIVLTLVSETAATLPAELGRANYAQTLARVGQRDAHLAAALHAADGAKQVTCSGVMNGRRDGYNLHVRAGEAYDVRITGLAAPVSDALIAALVDAPPTLWSLGHYAFQVIGAFCDPNDHPWSGCISYRDLLAMHQSRSPARKITLDFVSPTAFKSNAMQIPVPLPGLVFGSLLDRWNAFSPLPLDPALRPFAEATVAISRYRLESQVVPQKGGALRIGGVGTVTYTALDDDRYALAALNILADFAPYSGVGVQTATGMGQCRRVTT